MFSQISLMTELGLAYQKSSFKPVIEQRNILKVERKKLLMDFEPKG